MIENRKTVKPHNRITVKKIHRWLALPTGVFIAIMCFTGAILLLKSDIAALMGCEANDIALFKTVTKLHRWLFIAPENPHGGMSLGRIIMGLSAIAATLITLTGVMLWWPKNRKTLKSRLTISFNKGWRRFVYDSHVSLGIYAAVFLLLMSLTGPVWSFRWYRTAATVVTGTKDGGHGGAGHGSRPAEAAPFTHGRIGNTAKMHGERPDKGAQHGGKAPAQRVFISLHTGKGGGAITKALYFLAAIIGGFLPISGYWMWWKNRAHKA